MSTVRTSNFGPLTGNTASVVDPSTPAGGIARVGTLVSFPTVSASGTTVTFSTIPSWVRRITLNHTALTKASGGGIFGYRIGSGSLATSGYTTYAWYNGGGSSGYAYNNSFGTVYTGTNYAISGTCVLVNMGTNLWLANYSISSNGPLVAIGSGYITLGGTLDRAAVTWDTDTFTGGLVNCFYE